MSYEGRTALIQNPHSGMVLDGKEEQVRLQHFTGEKCQQWTISTIRENVFKITNKANGMVLDSSHGSVHNRNVITYKFHGGPNQLWSIHENQITAADNINLVLDVADTHHIHGAQIILYNNHSGENQQFKVILLT